MNEMRIMLRITIVALILGCFWSSAGAVEPKTSINQGVSTLLQSACCKTMR